MSDKIHTLAENLVLSSITEQIPESDHKFLTSKGYKKMRPGVEGTPHEGSRYRHPKDDFTYVTHNPKNKSRPYGHLSSGVGTVGIFSTVQGAHNSADKSASASDANREAGSPLKS